ncbi:MAG: protein kinase family protein [Limnoraphis sp. WC205]|nr:protein kinase family protein [Limnoraphis sp. WC205]
MRLSELVNTVRARGREIFNFVSHPDATIRRIVRRRAQQIYEQVEIGGSDGNKQKKETPVSQQSQHSFQVEPTINRQRGGVQTRIQPATLDQPILTERSRRRRKDKTQKVLVQGYEIRDRFGRRYEIGQCLSHSDRIRQYEATPISQQKQRVFIQEYLTQSDSDYLAESNKQNGKVKEFRLLTPIDIIKDFYEDNPQDIRWYLIVEQLPKSLTLREYLQRRHQPLTPTQVSKILKQVLQTLQFLHNCYEVRLSQSMRTGIGHGNLNLDSILLVHNETQSPFDEEDEQFSIYLSRIALWENLIDSLESERNHPSLSKKAFQQDLEDLGRVSYLLSGGKQEIPDQDFQWHQHCHPELKNFILRLYSGEFKRASDAHRELFKLPLDRPLEPISANQIFVDSEQQPRSKSQRYWSIPLILLLATLVSLGILILGIRRFLSASTPPNPANIVFNKNSDPSQFAQVDIPSSLLNKSINYSADQRWKTALKTSVGYGANQSLANQLNPSQISLNLQPPNLFSFVREGNNTETLENRIISALKTSQFIVTSLLGNELQLLQDSEQLEVEIIAYDALLAYVAFSDVQREGSLPKLLSGKISLDSLKQLYSDQPLTLKDLGINNSPNQTIKRISICNKNPEEVFLVTSLFENLAWKNEGEIDNFRNLIDQDKKACTQTGYTKGQAIALAEFEQGGQATIGIDLFSKVFNQCSVYPLAIVGEGKLTAVQPIIQNNGSSITPETDLCMDKGSYKPNPKVFEQGDYPLGYAIAVIYKKEGGKDSAGQVFSNIMKTDEGQHLLHSAGLIPIREFKQSREEN